VALALFHRGHLDLVVGERGHGSLTHGPHARGGHSRGGGESC
jgi:hypothetical protein